LSEPNSNNVLARSSFSSAGQLPLREPEVDWAKDSWKNRSGVNVWGFITVDAERGIVYMPFGAPSVDQYGGDRAGDDLFGNSLVAADANTGKYLWHFQLVHRDLWDADLTDAPALIDVKQGGKTIPAVVAYTKVGLLFILDRVTGKPIYGWRASGAAKRGAAGTLIENPAVPSHTATVGEDDVQRGGHRDGHARVGSGLQETYRRRADGRALPSAGIQPAARAVPRQPWRGELGRDVVQSATGLSVRQHPRAGAELWTFRLGGAAEATPMTYQGRDGRPGGGLFNNPVTGDGVMAFVLERQL
jgi:glucose dehydrogenase